jgi:hypothetical protein
VHQPCTKLVQITCQSNLSKQPITTTCLIKFINQIRYTLQDQLARQLSTIVTISPICASTKHITTPHNHHQDQYVLLIIYQDKYATSSINHVSTILLTNTSNHVPSMYQSCINYTSTMTHQYVPTSSNIHLMYVPTHQLLVSTMYLTCTSTKIPHQFHHPNLICNFVIYLMYMITYLQNFLNFITTRD